MQIEREIKHRDMNIKFYCLLLFNLWEANTNTEKLYQATSLAFFLSSALQFLVRWCVCGLWILNYSQSFSNSIFLFSIRLFFKGNRNAKWNKDLVYCVTKKGNWSIKNIYHFRGFIFSLSIFFFFGIFVM